MIFELGEVASTNTSALELLAAGHRAPFLVRARAQTGGRGRAGRAWASPPGNFYGTFVVRPQRAVREAAQLSFVAAVALGQVLADLGLDPQLKWPNDVLIGGAKISGILLEMHGAHVLIGMGVNLSSHPAVPGYASTSLAELGLMGEALMGEGLMGEGLTDSRQIERFTKALHAALTAWLDCWQGHGQGQGFAPVRAAWLARAYGQGQAMQVRLPSATDAPGKEQWRKVLDGVFEGLDSNGALLLRTHEGREIIHAGDVYFHAVGD